MLRAIQRTLDRAYWRLSLRLARWRVERLVAQGLRLGRGVVLMPGVELDASYPWLIEIEDGCRLSEGVRILTHDATPFAELGVTRLDRVRILRDSFLGERAIVLPGVTIGPRAMVAAGAVVTRDVGEGMLAAGNPARVYGRFDEYIERQRETVAAGRIVALEDLASGAVSVAEVRDALARGEPVHVSGSPSATPYHYGVTTEEVAAAAREALRRNFGRER